MTAPRIGRLIALLAASSVLAAASANAAPPIAYAKLGSRGAQEVWLINPDGSSPTRVYSGPAKVSLSDLDVRPGGGQLAFIEGGTAIKVVSYDTSGVQTRVDIVPQAAGCRDYGLDFRGDGALLYGSNCGSGTSLNVKEWNGATSIDLIANAKNQVNKIRWLRDGSGFVWQTATATGLEFRKSDLGNPSSWTVIWKIPYPTGSVPNLDMAHQTDAMILNFGSSTQIERVPFDFAGVGPATVVATGGDGHFGPDDNQILYRVQTHKGWNLVVNTGGINRTIASAVGVTDWGN